MAKRRRPADSRPARTGTIGDPGRAAPAGAPRQTGGRRRTSNPSVAPGVGSDGVGDRVRVGDAATAGGRSASREPAAGQVASRVAAGLLALHVLVIVGFSVYYLVELARGEGDDRTRVVMSIVVFLVMAALIALLARGLFRRQAWAKTPAVLWNVLLVPVGWSLIQSDIPALGVPLLLVAVLGIIAVLASGSSRGPGTAA